MLIWQTGGAEELVSLENGGVDTGLCIPSSATHRRQTIPQSRPSLPRGLADVAPTILQASTSQVPCLVVLYFEITC
jgi:hypothetical protein